MRRLWAELYRRDGVLAVAGGLHLVLLAGALLVGALDERTVLGVNVWVKPSKFAVSIVIYLWTLAWLMAYIPGPGWCKRFVRWGSTVAMFAEIACIAGQAVRGVTSHYNQATQFDANVFTVMGLFILFNTLIEVLLLGLFFRRHVTLPRAYLWGIRMGLVGTLFSAVVGGLMIANGAHTVGASDGGPGLWLVNWSTEAGDLRVAHALGLHALQMLPLVGYGLSRVASPRRGVAWIVAFASAYGLVTVGLAWQALVGHALVFGG
jgi:hypothetical protein